MTAPTLNALTPNSGESGNLFDIEGTDLTDDVVLSQVPDWIFRFENNLDDSQGNYNLTDRGSVEYTSGIINDCVVLDGSTDSLETDLDIVAFRGAGGSNKNSFACWVYIESHSDYNTIFHVGENATGGFTSGVHFRVNSSGKIEFRNRSLDSFESSTILATQTWYHIALTLDTGMIGGSFLWINGVVDSNMNNFSVNPFWNTYDIVDNLCIGSQADQSNKFFGRIDECYFWLNKMITVADALALYNATSMPNPTITFNGSPVLGTSYSSTLIEGVQVPNLSPGDYPVIVTNGTGPSNSLDFTIISSAVPGEYEGDIKLFQTAPEYADIQLDKVDPTRIVLDDGLENYVLISLSTNKRAEDSDELPDNLTDRQGWFGDSLTDDNIGSHLWLLQRERLGTRFFTLATQYVKDALQWMVDDEIIDRIENVSVRRDPIGVNRVIIEAELIKLDEGRVGFAFFYNWQNQVIKRI